MIARTEELLVARIPYGEGKIALQMVDAGSAPGGVRKENQVAVGCVGFHLLLGALELFDQFVTTIQARVGDHPVAPFETDGLLLVEGFVGGAQERMRHPNRTVGADAAGVRPAKGEKIRKG